MNKVREQSVQQSLSYFKKKGSELTENLSIIQTQVKSAVEQLATVFNKYDETSGKINGHRGKLCTRCHQPGHDKACCLNSPCEDMNNCEASERHPESRHEILELQRLIKDLQKTLKQQDGRLWSQEEL